MKLGGNSRVGLKEDSWTASTMSRYQYKSQHRVQFMEKVSEYRIHRANKWARLVKNPPEIIAICALQVA